MSEDIKYTHDKDERCKDKDIKMPSCEFFNFEKLTEQLKEEE